MTTEIKDKDGNVIAEFGSDNEAYWYNALKDTEGQIKAEKNRLKFLEAVCRMCQEELDKAKT